MPRITLCSSALGAVSVSRPSTMWRVFFRYPDINIHRVRLSMKLGGEYRFRNIHLRHWQKLAEELGLDPGELVHRVDEIARQTVDYVPDVRRRVTEEGLPHPIVARLADALIARAAACRAILR